MEWGTTRGREGGRGGEGRREGSDGGRERQREGGGIVEISECAFVPRRRRTEGGRPILHSRGQGTLISSSACCLLCSNLFLSSMAHPSLSLSILRSCSSSFLAAPSSNSIRCSLCSNSERTVESCCSLKKKQKLLKCYQMYISQPQRILAWKIHKTFSLPPTPRRTKVIFN